MDLFLELLQVSLGTRDSLSWAPSAADWGGLLAESQRQVILGVMTCGIERLPKEQQPPKTLLLQWVGLTIQIEQQNTLTSKACHAIVERFYRDGYKACVLKGQANLRFYPNEMNNRRNCGDVDIWVKLKLSESRNKKDVRTVLEYVNTAHKMTGLCWLHCNYIDESGVPVEVHFRLSFMNEPCRNRRFLKHFADFDKCVLSDNTGLPVMKVDEDVIYQMNHIYRHLIDEGVGLRQVVDYYWLLRTWNEQHERTKEETMKIVSWLGMRRFAGALMYVLREVCGISEDMLLCPASVRDGQFLLDEIMTAGNFGHNDPRMKGLPSHRGFLKQVSQAWRRFKRNLRFLTSYPGEVIWEPFARIYHYAWKILKLWRL